MDQSGFYRLRACSTLVPEAIRRVQEAQQNFSSLVLSKRERKYSRFDLNQSDRDTSSVTNTTRSKTKRKTVNSINLHGDLVCSP